MGWLNDPQIWASLVTLTALEIVLGIDNLVRSLRYWPGGCRPIAKIGLGRSDWGWR